MNGTTHDYTTHDYTIARLYDSTTILSRSQHNSMFSPEIVGIGELEMRRDFTRLHDCMSKQGPNDQTPKG